MNSLADIKVSVIVPIYNVEKYLEQCLTSLALQTLPEMEFILIDDGSTDSSGRIADDFVRKHSRFKIIHQENKGYAGARNAALPIAMGKYLGFVDSDDWVKPTTFQTLYELAETEHADVAGGSFEYYYQADQITVPYNNRSFVRLLQKNHGRLRNGAEAALFDCAVTWNRIYLRRMIQQYDIRFAENMAMAEDVPFFLESFVAARKIAMTEKCLYVYRNQRPGQQTSFRDGRLFAFFTLFDNFSNFLKRCGITDLEPWLLHLKLSRFCYGYENAAPEIRAEFFHRICEAFTEDHVTAASLIAPGPGWGKYGMLRILHPLSKRAILRRDEKSFARIVRFRMLLGNAPRIIVGILFPKKKNNLSQNSKN